MEIKSGENPNPPRWTGVKKNTGTCNPVSVLAHIERGWYAEFLLRCSEELRISKTYNRCIAEG
jgi:hypothetical protein